MANVADARPQRVLQDRIRYGSNVVCCGLGISSLLTGIYSNTYVGKAISATLGVLALVGSTYLQFAPVPTRTPSDDFEAFGSREQESSNPHYFHHLPSYTPRMAHVSIGTTDSEMDQNSFSYRKMDSTTSTNFPPVAGFLATSSHLESNLSSLPQDGPAAVDDGSTNDSQIDSNPNTTSASSDETSLKQPGHLSRDPRMMFAASVPSGVERTDVDPHPTNVDYSHATNQHEILQNFFKSLLSKSRPGQEAYSSSVSYGPAAIPFIDGEKKRAKPAPDESGDEGAGRTD